MDVSVMDIGEQVVCDSCNKDFSASDESGGFIFGSYGYGPCCAERMMESIIKYNEQDHIKARCPESISFKEFILKYRGGDNTIKIYSWK